MPRLSESDWGAVEKDYRAGLLTDRQIGEKYGVSHGSVQQQAKKRGWARNLIGRSVAKAEEKLAKEELANKLASTTKVATEREIVEATSETILVVLREERADVRRTRAVVQKLWDAVDAELDHPNELANLGDIMASPDEAGGDKLNDMYRAAIGLPQQIKNVKLLADALKVLIELERKVFRIDDQPDDPPPANQQPSGGSVTIEAVTALMDKIAEARGKS